MLIDISFEPEAVILANGEFPKHPITTALLNNSKYLVCCDGATNQLIDNSNRLPNAIVGDLDSLSEENKLRFSGIVYHVGEQETNDLTKSVKFCLNRGIRNIIILGATGKREDHTIGNISLLAEYIGFEGTNICMVTDFGIFTAIKENSSFESYAGQQVSIFNINDAQITSSNLKYPIQDRAFSNWSQGTLNESEGNIFELKTTEKVVVFRAF